MTGGLEAIQFGCSCSVSCLLMLDDPVNELQNCITVGDIATVRLHQNAT